MDSLPPSIVKDKPYAIDEGYLSEFCRFMTILMYVPPMNGGEHKLHVNVEIEFEGGLFDGAHRTMIVYMDNAF